MDERKGRERGGERGITGESGGRLGEIVGRGQKRGGGGQVKREREKQGVTVWVTHSNMSRK